MSPHPASPAGAIFVFHRDLGPAAIFLGRNFQQCVAFTPHFGKYIRSICRYFMRSKSYNTYTKSEATESLTKTVFRV